MFFMLCGAFFTFYRQGLVGGLSFRTKARHQLATENAYVSDRQPFRVGQPFFNIFYIASTIMNPPIAQDTSQCQVIDLRGKPERSFAARFARRQFGSILPRRQARREIANRRARLCY
jgi:hypothetical protein